MLRWSKSHPLTECRREGPQRSVRARRPAHAHMTRPSGGKRRSCPTGPATHPFCSSACALACASPRRSGRVARAPTTTGRAGLSVDGARGCRRPWSLDRRHAAVGAHDVGGRSARGPSGVFVKSRGGLGSFTSVSIRGSADNEVAILVDGMPLSRAATGASISSALSVAGLERVEVWPACRRSNSAPTPSVAPSTSSRAGAARARAARIGRRRLVRRARGVGRLERPRSRPAHRSVGRVQRRHRRLHLLRHRRHPLQPVGRSHQHAPQQRLRSGRPRRHRDRTPLSPRHARLRQAAGRARRRARRRRIAARARSSRRARSSTAKPTAASATGAGAWPRRCSTSGSASPTRPATSRGRSGPPSARRKR